jgi:S1-C subfamily serine protease
VSQKRDGGEKSQGTNVASALSASLAAAVERGGPSVVRVHGRRAPSSGIVWSEDGLVVAAHHSVEWDEGIEVGLPDGTTVAAAVVGRDPTTDLVLVRAQAKGLVPPSWADPASVSVGHLALALSRPGRSVRASLGIVSVRGESWRTPGGGRVDVYLQSDLARHPGFSGGLLVDASGQGLGLNTAGLLRGAALALPAPTLQRVVESLVAHGRVRRGFLGIGTYPVRIPPAIEKDAGQPGALLLVSVEPGSPADEAGLRLGDVLLSFDGHTLRHPSDLLPLLDETRVGAVVSAKILRGGEPREVRVSVGSRNG